jgi:hypothetical protein
MSAGVKLLLEATCILLGGQPTRKKDFVTGNMVEDYTPAVKSMMMVKPEQLYCRLRCVSTVLGG